MERLYGYFRDLSEGKLDIEKTIEYQFIKALQQMETPIGLNAFAKELNLTSIIIKLLGLMNNSGLIAQTEFGIDTNITGELTPKPPFATDQQMTQRQEPQPPVFKPSRSPPSVNAPPATPKNVPSPVPTETSTPSSSNVPSVPQTTSTPVSAKENGDDSSSDSIGDELPPHMQERLNFERMRTGSRKAKFGLGEDGLQDLFDQLGSLEDELKEDEWD